MTPEAQRIAIAKARGWTQSTMSKRACFDPSGLSTYWDNAPDYLNDLNAMHEAEKVLTPEQWLVYGRLLVNCQCAPDECEIYDFSDEDIHSAAHATAAQRAEAFLRTIGKWTP